MAELFRLLQKGPNSSIDPVTPSSRSLGSGTSRARDYSKGAPDLGLGSFRSRCLAKRHHLGQERSASVSQGLEALGDPSPPKRTHPRRFETVSLPEGDEKGKQRSHEQYGAIPFRGLWSGVVGFRVTDPGVGV